MKTPKNTYRIPGIPPIVETADDRFEVDVKGPGYWGGGFWFESLHAAIVFAIGEQNRKSIDRVRAAAFLLGVIPDDN